MKNSQTSEYPNPVPGGSLLSTQWQTNRITTPPALGVSKNGVTQWVATVLLSPFGDSISPLKNYSQLVVGRVECQIVDSPDDGVFSNMRVSLYNTQDLTFFDFIFCHSVDINTGAVQNQWYWLDSTPNGPVNRVLGPFDTTVQPPAPSFMADNGALWGNVYALMGISSDHWVVPTPGSSDHGSWCAFRRDTGQLFRIFMMDSTNPLMLPVIGSYYIANFPTFTPAADLSASTLSAIALIKRGETQASASGYWNPMVTQEDIQRAMAFPLAQSNCTLADIQAVIPGFVPVPANVPTPRWSDQTYIEGWTLGTDFIPYWTRVCYLWTGDASSQQQSVFVGLGLNAGQGNYVQRTDSCLNTNETAQPYYKYPSSGSGEWTLNQCLPALQGVGLPYPDWLSRDAGVAMGQITGNANFGLQPGQTLNLFAAELPRGGGAMAIFWLWFASSGDGVLFTEGNYINPLSHNLQLIDYTLFVQNAGLTASAFANPCGWSSAPAVGTATVSRVSGHPTSTSAAGVSK
jgi:hypothetical protein